MEADELDEEITVHMETDVNAHEQNEFEVLMEGNEMMQQLESFTNYNIE